MKEIYTLKYQRNEYGKQIRKQYELHEIVERRCNMREWTIDKSGIVHAITTVMKDFGYILEIEDA